MRLLSATDRSRFDAEVISLMDIGVTGDRIRDLGFPVRSLGMQRGFPNPMALLKLISWLREDRPRVLATWMYHANLMGSIAAPFAGGMPVVWGIHHGHLDHRERTRTRLVARACAWLPRGMVAKIICCSEHTRNAHRLIGYDPAKMVVIRNGFDLSTFRPDRGHRERVRKELRIANDAPVLFLAGRFHPQKDYPNFVAAAAILRRTIPEARFVLCGHDVAWENPVLTQWICDAGLKDSFRLLGRRDDVPDLINSSDIACSSSAGEAFSLAIGEAMSCGVPCVVTDVGDSAVLVEDTGRVVPPSDPEAFAAACESLLGMPEWQRNDLGRAARRRILDNFELSHVANQYQQLYESVVFGRAYPPGRVADSIHPRSEAVR